MVPDSKIENIALAIDEGDRAQSDQADGKKVMESPLESDRKRNAIEHVKRKEKSKLKGAVQVLKRNADKLSREEYRSHRCIQRMDDERIEQV